MPKCTNCKIEYPSYYLNQLTMMGKIHGIVCGICALEMGNKLMGLDRLKFDGERAEQLRLDAIKWRKEHTE